MVMKVFINVPWWYPAYYRMINAIFTTRTKSKFVFVGPSRSAETLFKFIAPEQVPAQYGGLSKEGEQEFTTADLSTEDTVKPTSKHTIEFPVTEAMNSDRPVVFINTDLLRAFVTNDRKAVNNLMEANIITEIVHRLLRRGILEEDIGIITPYNSQADLIRQAVSTPVEIHTIDKYQGRDKDCILLSFVRSSENPRNYLSSLLGDWHRINVALTRAKKKLIMVGSCITLSNVPLLKLLIEKVEVQGGILSISQKDLSLKPELKRCSNKRC